MSQRSLGLIETYGLLPAVEAADAAIKSANVELIGYEFAKGSGMTVVKVEGDVGAVKAAIAAASSLFSSSATSYGRSNPEKKKTSTSVPIPTNNMIFAPAM